MSKASKTISIVMILFVLPLLVACGSNSDLTTTATATPKPTHPPIASNQSGPKTYSMKFQVTGTAVSVYSIYYSTASNANNNLYNVSLPWSYNFTATSGNNVVLSAVMKPGDSGTVTVTILADNKVLATSNGTGSSNSYICPSAAGGLP